MKNVLKIDYSSLVAFLLKNSPNQPQDLTIWDKAKGAGKVQDLIFAQMFVNYKHNY